MSFGVDESPHCCMAQKLTTTCWLGKHSGELACLAYLLRLMLTANHRSMSTVERSRATLAVDSVVVVCFGELRVVPLDSLHKARHAQGICRKGWIRSSLWSTGSTWTKAERLKSFKWDTLAIPPLQSQLASSSASCRHSGGLARELDLARARSRTQQPFRG